LADAVIRIGEKRGFHRMSSLALAVVVLTLTAVATATTSAWSQSEPRNDDAFALGRSIGRGINLGNGSGFGAYNPPEKQWGTPLLDTLISTER
jgi:hypothetical protein